MTICSMVSADIIAMLRSREGPATVHNERQYQYYQ